MGVVEDKRDFFLCHAWEDRAESAKELHDKVESSGASVWFSEKDIELGAPMLRTIDKGMANSRVGIVLVTPAMLRKLPTESIADKELSALLVKGRLIPILHGTTFDELNNVSPLLASRAGMSTAENTMAEIATKLAQTVIVQ